MLLVDNGGNAVESELPPDEVAFYRGKKRYEMSNHLGNVLAVVSDKRTLVCVGGFQHYEAEIIVAQDYYPFGMLMPERSYTATTEGYRFGFQGQEGDDEVNGKGNSYAFKYRIYDPRLGRFLSIDPLYRKYPSNGSYNFSENIVINAIELEGLEAFFIHGLRSSHEDWAKEGFQRVITTTIAMTSNNTIENANAQFDWSEDAAKLKRPVEA
jgi:RHS repeat-associated protein